ncbi:MAG: YdcF family protein [Anaerolineales bacterium]
MKKPEAILIPGGGLNKTGHLHPWTKARLDLALEHDQGNVHFLLLSGGTVHKPPPLNGDGFPLFESRVAAAYLMDKGIPAQRILTEISSYDTIGNAFFSRMLHVQPRGLQNLLLITSQFHVQRVQTAFQWVYNLTPVPFKFHLSFKASPDQGLSKELLQARIAKERRSLEALQKTTEKIHTLHAFHNWFFTQHEAYAVGKTPNRLGGHIVESY